VKLFADTKIPLLSKALDAYSLRQKTIASNIANISTIGYRSNVVRFEEELEGAMQGTQLQGTETNDRHMAIGSPTVENVQPRIEVAPQGDPFASGVNNVDVDHEMAELASDQIRFKYAARLISEMFKGIQTSIKGTS
jgi:flagellar basal-body rod protein FlgB